ncbi:MAG: cobyrinate a,c-diamide synthase, partial [Pseudomonadota bacterium]
RQGQTLGAVVAGLCGWSSEISVAGVILNRVASPRHARMLAQGLAGVCPVLGEVPVNDAFDLRSRHLGLVQAAETAGLEAKISAAAALVAQSCDMEAIAAATRPVAHQDHSFRFKPLGQRIAVARDAAFSFAYCHQAEDWRSQGAEIIPFSPLMDEAPDEGADAIFLPGGYPELHAGVLARAVRVRTGIARAIARGTLIYGECGGYMVLGEHLVDQDGIAHDMFGALRLVTSFQRKTRHLGYRTVEGDTPFGDRFAAHEFHYTSVVKERGIPLFPTVRDGEGATLPAMGLREGRVMGSFAHLIESMPREVI